MKIFFRSLCRPRLGLMFQERGRGWPAAARFKRGDEVYASLGLEGGGYAEYPCKETIIAGNPARWITCTRGRPVAGLTAWQALFEVVSYAPVRRC